MWLADDAADAGTDASGGTGRAGATPSADPAAGGRGDEARCEEGEKQRRRLVVSHAGSRGCRGAPPRPGRAKNRSHSTARARMSDKARGMWACEHSRICVTDY